MIINTANMDALRVGFNTSYEGAFSQVPVLRDKVSTTVPSSTGENIYAWLGELPGMNEWLGPRVVNNLENHDYRIKNRDWEQTIGVDRNAIEDDTFGQYSTRFEILGRSAARHPEKMVYDALAAGFTADCYDGQPFFDTDHPVIGADGAETTIANTDGGSGTAWFLIAGNEVIKPIIFQERKKAQFAYKDSPTDDNVFMNKKFIYGADARYAVGYGFWQMAWGSKQTLNATNFKAAFAAIEGMKGDHGHPMGLTPTTLVVPPSLRSAGLELLNSERNAAGATNVWKGTAELLVVPWLA